MSLKRQQWQGLEVSGKPENGLSLKKFDKIRNNSRTTTHAIMPLGKALLINNFVLPSYDYCIQIIYMLFVSEFL